MKMFFFYYFPFIIILDIPSLSHHLILPYSLIMPKTTMVIHLPSPTIPVLTKKISEVIFDAKSELTSTETLLQLPCIPKSHASSSLRPRCREETKFLTRHLISLYQYCTPDNAESTSKLEFSGVVCHLLPSPDESSSDDEDINPEALSKLTPTKVASHGGNSGSRGEEDEKADWFGSMKSLGKMVGSGDDKVEAGEEGGVRWWMTRDAKGGEEGWLKEEREEVRMIMPESWELG